MSAIFVAISLGIAMFVVWFLVWWSEGKRVVHARELLAGGAPLVDVDAPEEFAKDHPSGARSVPFERLAVEAPELGAHRQPLVVYGHHPWRSLFAAWRLRAIGFHEVVNVGKAQV